MAEATWKNTDKLAALEEPKTNRMKFAIAGVVMITAVIFLLINGMRGTQQLYFGVEELGDATQHIGEDLKLAGWVVGDSIEYTQIDATTSRLEFDVVDDLNNPQKTVRIVAMNEPKPDLLQHEAQALVEGHFEDGQTFYVNEGGLLLKCPTRYEELEPA